MIALAFCNFISNVLACAGIAIFRVFPVKRLPGNDQYDNRAVNSVIFRVTATV